MRKLLALLLVAVSLFALSGCSDEVLSSGESLLLYKNTLDDTSANVSFDMDNDGEDENIELTLSKEGFILLTSGEKEISLGNTAYYISEVYGIDIDVNDTFKELAVISTEDSSDMVLRVLRLDENGFTPVLFDTLSGEEGYEAYLGYEPQIEVSNGTIKTSKRGRYGMWCVEAEFTYKGTEFREEVKKERAVVRSSYKDMAGFIENESEAYLRMGIIKDIGEVESLKEGYVVAHADFVNTEKAKKRDEMILLKAGDEFKIVAEDSEGFVKIEKKTGESGWIYMGKFKDNRDEVSPIAFFMAD